MTEKRFTQRLYETGERFLEDNKTNCFYEIKDSFVNVALLCERLNKLVDENEQLKKQKQQYKGQRDYLLFVIEKRCSKELFEETKSYLKGGVE